MEKSRQTLQLELNRFSLTKHTCVPGRLLTHGAPLPAWGRGGGAMGSLGGNGLAHAPAAGSLGLSTANVRGPVLTGELGTRDRTQVDLFRKLGFAGLWSVYLGTQSVSTPGQGGDGEPGGGGSCAFSAPPQATGSTSNIC